MSAATRSYPVSAEPLERLHALLLEAVRRRRQADPHASPVTVAEIYQELAPYRSVRGALGLDMNADYEHTLVRLLSGEANLARIEPAAAREQLQRELESSNPNVALYRKFAGCDVWLLPSGAATPAWVEEDPADMVEATPAGLPPNAAAQAAADTSEPRAAPPEPPGPLAAAPQAPALTPAAGSREPADAPAAGSREPADTPAAGSRESADTPAAASDEPPVTRAERARQPEQPREMKAEQEKTAAAPAASPAAATRAAVPVEAGVHCAFCDSLLPVFRQVRFCPFCGADQSQRPCAVCGEPLQPDWAYCIACGEAVAASA